jgi:hypothetical protein
MGQPAGDERVGIALGRVDFAAEITLTGRIAMQKTDMARQPVNPVSRLSHLDNYNFKHFRTKHWLSDMQATIDKCGIAPGMMAPDFELPGVDGLRWRLSEQHGKPILLHFGSFT